MTTINTRLVKDFTDIGFSVDIDNQNKLWNIRGPISATLEFLDKYPTMFASGDGISEAAGYLNTSDTGWTGGGPDKFRQDLAGEIDMGPFIAEKERLEKTGLIERLQTMVSWVNPIRRRKMSEDDGAWDYSRRFEEKPFIDHIKQPNVIRSIDIVCDMAVNGSATSEDFNKYGAMAWALINIVESAGISVSLSLRFDLRRLAGNDPNWSGDLIIDVKRSGEYVAPSLIACMMQTVFFRRNIFAIMQIIPELNGMVTASNLGNARPVSGINFSSGVLCLAPDIINGISGQWEAELLKAIGGQAAA